jgi:hypothetical protein
VKENRKEARGGELARYTVERGDQVGSEGEGGEPRRRARWPSAWGLLMASALYVGT